MLLSLRFTLFALWGIGAVEAALNLDGSQAVEPASEDDPDVPSPIGDINTYEPDQHDCSPACVNYANPHSWIPYLSVDRLHRCKEPMLLQLSVTQPLDDPDSTVLIRSCTVGSGSSTNSSSASTAAAVAMDNPKKDDGLVQGGSLRVAPACAISGTPIDTKLSLATSGEAASETEAGRAINLLRGMQKFFDAKDNCNERFLFAYNQDTVASLYIGAGLGRPTAKSALEALAEHLQTSPSVSNRTVAEACGGDRQPERVLGISVDTSGDLAAVQNAALQWSKGNCMTEESFKSAGHLTGVKLFDIGGANSTFVGNASSPSPRGIGSRALDLGKRYLLGVRAVCKHIQVESGDSCAALSARCGIRGADFLKYNPAKNLCANLKGGDYVCCSVGDPFTPPKPDSPKPGADGVCATHLIENGDSCDSLAKKHGITVQDIEKWNKGKTWAWTECKDMLIGYNMCLSSGSPPMPPPQEGAACGPLVLGTKPPKDSSTSLADLNPCPLKACCSNWGFCGVFPDHCTINAPKDGGPGTKKKGFQNTCVSNCGNPIKENSGPPASFQRIGYYEAFGLARDCLWLKAKNANTDGTYTHIHWAFASIDPKTWKPIIKEGNEEWASFKKLKAKRIVSFGGWADSTEPDKYNIIRQAIITNRAPDIMVGGKPIGQKRDGLDYLRFLTVLREKLDSTKSVSIAAPASYWYLKAFPIDEIAKVIDYIVYMTYDLHGQWDYGNPNAFDMCESGKCIRSHVNMTETKNALSMITKAGVPNNKIFVGEASYGRSFHMAKDGCWKPTCEFTGSRTESDAKPGRCTKTGGYLAYAEIMEIRGRNGDKVEAFYDQDSKADVMLYEDSDIKGRSEDPADVDLNRLCRFACKYGYCPDDVCTTEPVEEPQYYEEVEDDDPNSGDLSDYRDNKWQNRNKCYIYKDTRDAEANENLAPCRQFCQAEIEETSEEGDITNYGCVGLFPLDKEIPWQRSPFGSGEVAPGECKCNAWFVNYLAETVIEALPIIAQLILDMGLSFLPGPGKALSAGYDMALTAAETISYIYPKDEDPAGAFQWWVSPCGGSDLVPDDIKQIFDILNMVPAGRSRFKEPKKIKKESGKKGDEGNPRSATGPRNPQTGGNPKPKPKRCNVTPRMSTRRMGQGKNTLRFLSCDKNNVKQTVDLAVTKMTYGPNAQALPVTRLCSSAWSQACFHYSSAVSNNPHWATLTCVQEAASTKYSTGAHATMTWASEHHPSWTQTADRPWKKQCDKDEYPPKYFLNGTSPEFKKAGIDKTGQRIRVMPYNDNENAGRLWKSVCFKDPLLAMTDKDLYDRMQKGSRKSSSQVGPDHEKTEMEIVIDHRPEFTLRYHHNKPKDDGLWDNGCWPNGLAAGDPGFALLSLDEWYDKNTFGHTNQRTKWNYLLKATEAATGYLKRGRPNQNA
ncbi:hypothetical protein ACJ41O_008876 [Fusarium nematophilum]